MSADRLDDAHDHVGRRLRTLEQCALHKRTLRLTCPTCGRSRVMDAAALWWLFRRKGWDDALPGVANRLCCEPCRDGRKAVVRPRWAVTRDEPEGPQPPHPDRHDWRRLVSRYRS